MVLYLRQHHVALLALFIALGGTSYAAIKLPRNSVGAPQIKSGAVMSKEVKDHSLKRKDFARRSLPRGPKGAPGPAGPKGTAALASPTGQVTLPVVQASQTFDVRLTNNTWGSTQAEPVLIAGNAHFPTFPCAGAPNLDTVLDLFVDGTSVYLFRQDLVIPGGESNIPFLAVTLAPPGQHTVTARAAYSCSNAPTTLTLTVNVLGHG